MATHSTRLTLEPPAAGLAARWRRTFPARKRWERAPLWLAALFTGAKSFADNPILGSPALNRAGLHVWRLKSAHALARWRRARLARLVPKALCEQFDRDGFVVLPEVLPPGEFSQLQQALLETEFECRAHQQGDTITRRVPVGPELRRRLPSLAKLLDDRRWRGLMAYVASARTKPFYYIQTIAGGVADGPADPQLELHSDTFHPSLKAWLFLTDIADDGRPLIYVAGSHRLSPERIEWERHKSMTVMESGDRLSQRGSFRVDADELGALGLPPPTRFSVSANTLVVADTCGFHARAGSHRPTIRVEIWAYCRRNPFLPWTAAGLLSMPFVRDRRMEWLLKLFDWLDRRGLRKQQWMHAGLKRPIDA